MSAIESFDAEFLQSNADWRNEARCADGSGAMVALFFSEQLDDINRAKAFCAGCEVRLECLSSALARREPWGVWGGELLANGKVIVNKRPRGRPRKVRPGEVDPSTLPPPELHPRDVPIARTA